AAVGLVGGEGAVGDHDGARRFVEDRAAHAGAAAARGRAGASATAVAAGTTRGDIAFAKAAAAAAQAAPAAAAIRGPAAAAAAAQAEVPVPPPPPGGKVAVPPAPAAAERRPFRAFFGPRVTPGPLFRPPPGAPKFPLILLAGGPKPSPAGAAISPHLGL